MEIILERTYYSNGTNGILFCNGNKICSTIELPWRSNAQRVSCIPEGVYPLRKRYSGKFLWHLEVLAVARRSLILIHPANDAQKELRGCIAPVWVCQGPGIGSRSRLACQRLKDLVFPILEQGLQVFINIKGKQS